MLDNNISSSSYFDKLQHTLKQREMSPTYTSPIKLNNSILNQARLLQQKKKQINYH
ncbi:Asparaginyl-tRNA synthetase [Moritella viscosa]|nr:Asparaginyl-tRNA synthetase [Moritella viscosa]